MLSRLGSWMYLSFTNYFPLGVRTSWAWISFVKSLYCVSLLIGSKMPLTVPRFVEYRTRSEKPYFWWWAKSILTSVMLIILLIKSRTNIFFCTLILMLIGWSFVNFWYYSENRPTFALEALLSLKGPFYCELGWITDFILLGKRWITIFRRRSLGSGSESGILVNTSKLVDWLLHLRHWTVDFICP